MASKLILNTKNPHCNLKALHEKHILTQDLIHNSPTLNSNHTGLLALRTAGMLPPLYLESFIFITSPRLPAQMSSNQRRLPSCYRSPPHIKWCSFLLSLYRNHKTMNRTQVSSSPVPLACSCIDDWQALHFAPRYSPGACEILTLLHYQ